MPVPNPYEIVAANNKLHNVAYNAMFTLLPRAGTSPVDTLTRVMDGIGRDFPPGDLRVSDADRDRALAELGEAFRAGRITADEFDQRSGHALRARTGKELTALLADLPLAGPFAAAIAVPEPAEHAVAARCVMGASAFGAALLFARALPIALTPGHYWADSVGPEAVALLLVALIVFLHVIRADRRRP